MEIIGPNPKDVVVTIMVAEEGRGNRISQRVAPSQIPQPPTLEQLYLRDKEQILQNSSIKITPCYEILKLTHTIKHRLIPITILNLAQFDQAMRKIHEE